MPAGPQNKGGNAVAVRPYPFPVGVYESLVQDYDNTVTLGATAAAWTSQVQAPLWNVSPTGWMRKLWFDFTLFFASGNAAGSFAADGPWSLIQKITLYDLGGEVVLQLLGYEWLLLNKFGGYFEIGDPRADITYVTNPAAGNSQASPVARFIEVLPLEAVARDALGVVQNESKPGWKVEIWIDSAANAQGTGATAFTATAVSPQVRIRGYIDSYTEPAAAAPNGTRLLSLRPFPVLFSIGSRRTTRFRRVRRSMTLRTGLVSRFAMSFTTCVMRVTLPVRRRMRTGRTR